MDWKKVHLDRREWAKTCTEVELFKEIYGLGGSIWIIEHEIYHDRLEEQESTREWLKIARATQEHLVSMTNRFGVEQPMAEDKTPTKEYWDWYKRMKEEHFKNVLG